MALERSFVEAFVHGAAHRVLGARLLPFSVWHQFLLESIESPLATPGKAVLPADLRRAAAICRCRYPHADLGEGFSLKAFVAMAGKGRFERELKKFLDYRADYDARPEFNVHRTQSSASAGPHLDPPPAPLRLVADLIGWMRCSRQEAWDMTLGEAHWWQAMAFREKGMMLDFLTEESRSEMERIEAEDPELAAQMRRAAQLYREGKWQPFG